MKMKYISLSILVALSLGITGCATGVPGGASISPSSAKYISRVDTGTVKSVRYVVVKDDGTGTLLGAAIGAVLGHQLGKGKGRDLATLSGGLAGAYVGNQVAKANAQELTVKLDKGRTVVVVTKGTKFYPNERVRIIRQGNRVVNVEPL